MTKKTDTLEKLKKAFTYSDERQLNAIRLLTAMFRGEVYIVRLGAFKDSVGLYPDRDGGYLVDSKFIKTGGVVEMEEFTNTLVRSYVLDYIRSLPNHQMIITKEGRVHMNHFVIREIINYMGF